MLFVGFLSRNPSQSLFSVGGCLYYIRRYPYYARGTGICLWFRKPWEIPIITIIIIILLLSTAFARFRLTFVSANRNDDRYIMQTLLKGTQSTVTRAERDLTPSYVVGLRPLQCIILVSVVVYGTKWYCDRKAGEIYTYPLLYYIHIIMCLILF